MLVYVYLYNGYIMDNFEITDFKQCAKKFTTKKRNKLLFESFKIEQI